MKNIAIFASGSGSNAENIVKHFAGNKKVNISLILTNNPDAFVVKRAINLGVNYLVFDRKELYSSDKILSVLLSKNIHFIVLAGFLWLVPDNIIKTFEGRMINIHPALLPLYGGKGMYGDKVHKAVVENGDKESGITIHYVNKFYDKGDIIFQAICPIEPGDNAKDVAGKVHQLEYKHLPIVIEKLIGEL